MESEFCEQCNKKKKNAKVRWDLDFPLVLCDNCYNGFKHHSLEKTESIKNNKMER